MAYKPPRWLFFAILIVATVGAGLADMAYTDVVPLRPYTSLFNNTPVSMIGRASITTDVIMVTLLITLVAALIRVVANQTTGIVVAHSGFTPNGNLTGSPGVPSILPLYPLMFAFIGLVLAMKYLRRSDGGI